MKIVIFNLVEYFTFNWVSRVTELVLHRINTNYMDLNVFSDIFLGELYYFILLNIYMEIYILKLF